MAKFQMEISGKYPTMTPEEVFEMRTRLSKQINNSIQAGVDHLNEVWKKLGGYGLPHPIALDNGYALFQNNSQEKKEGFSNRPECLDYIACRCYVGTGKVMPFIPSSSICKYDAPDATRPWMSIRELECFSAAIPVLISYAEQQIVKNAIEPESDEVAKGFNISGFDKEQPVEIAKDTLHEILDPERDKSMGNSLPGFLTENVKTPRKFTGEEIKAIIQQQEKPFGKPTPPVKGDLVCLREYAAYAAHGDDTYEMEVLAILPDGKYRCKRFEPAQSDSPAYFLELDWFQAPELVVVGRAAENKKGKKNKDLIPITINGKLFYIKAGNYTEENLRNDFLKSVNPKDILSYNNGGFLWFPFFREKTIASKCHLEWHAPGYKPCTTGKFVPFELNGKTYYILSGVRSVDMILKDFASLAEDEILSIWHEDQWKDLTADVATMVNINGGEKFISHHPGGKPA